MYLQHRCVRYLEYIVNSQSEDKKVSITEVPIVNEFPDIFNEVLLSIPLERQVEFRIDLIP